MEMSLNYFKIVFKNNFLYSIKKYLFLLFIPETFCFGLTFTISQGRELIINNNTKDQSHSLLGISYSTTVL